MTTSPVVSQPAAMASRSLSNQNVLHLRVASLKYSQKDGTTASMMMLKNARASENTTAEVQVHSHPRRKALPLSARGARRRRMLSGMGSLMVGGPRGSWTVRFYRPSPGERAGPGCRGSCESVHKRSPTISDESGGCATHRGGEGGRGSSEPILRAVRTLPPGAILDHPPRPAGQRDLRPHPVVGPGPRFRRRGGVVRQPVRLPIGAGLPLVRLGGRGAGETTGGSDPHVHPALRGGVHTARRVRL